MLVGIFVTACKDNTPHFTLRKTEAENTETLTRHVFGSLRISWSQMTHVGYVRKDRGAHSQGWDQARPQLNLALLLNSRARAN